MDMNDPPARNADGSGDPTRCVDIDPPALYGREAAEEQSDGFRQKTRSGPFWGRSAMLSRAVWRSYIHFFFLNQIRQATTMAIETAMTAG